jgi:protein SCO1/2
MQARQWIITAMAGVGGFAVAALLIVLTMTSQRSGQAGIGSIGGPFTLVDDIGKPVSDKTLAGKPYAIYFGYTYCPEVCPTTLFDLTRWIKKLGPDADKLNYVFVTVDPERDTPKLMHSYLSSFDKRIRGFTGTPAQIAKIAGEYRVYYKKIPTSDGSYVMDHSSMIYLMDAEKKFDTIIAYQEKDVTAVAKLKSLASQAPTS